MRALFCITLTLFCVAFQACEADLDSRSTTKSVVKPEDKQDAVQQRIENVIRTSMQKFGNNVKISLGVKNSHGKTAVESVGYRVTSHDGSLTLADLNGNNVVSSPARQDEAFIKRAAYHLLKEIDLMWAIAGESEGNSRSLICEIRMWAGGMPSQDSESR
jgi:hypothetical protein